MSYRTLSTKPLNASLKTLLKRSGHIGLGISAFTPVLALANPTGGQVAAGQASIANPSANGMVITQKSQSAIINWQQFSIGAGQYVQFLQSSSSSVVLNRVIGGSPSSILGSLTGNGQVFLVNTNGVFFGKGASIDTQGFLASTLGITDANFLAHNYVFDQAGAQGATVVNDGNITASHSGYVVLAGDYAENDGIISAQSGHVILASGAKATLSLNGNNLINFAVNQSTLAGYAGVKNTGSLLADGGTVIMTADVANLLKSTVVNNTGLVEAHAMSDKGGAIYLTASGGNIDNAGTLDVSAARSGQAGGAITLKGDEHTILTDTSKIDATGEGANGGSVEVSGNTIALRGNMAIGKGGKLLLDPGSIELVSTSTANGLIDSPGTSLDTLSIGHVGVKFIEKQLNTGADVKLEAVRNISAAGSVTAITATTTVAQHGGGSLNLVADNGAIKLGGVNITIAGKLMAGAHTHASFGYIQAGSASLAAYAGDIDLAIGKDGSDSHDIVRFSAKTTTGGLTITAANLGVHGTGEVGIALDAKTNLSLNANIGKGTSHFGSSVTLMGATVQQSGDIFTHAKFTAVASAGYAHLQQVAADQGAAITATGGNITFEQITATGGSVAITDKKGTVTGVGAAEASGDLGLTLTAKNIEHSGSGGLTLEAGEGNLTISGIFGASSAAGLGAPLELKGEAISVNNRIKASQVDITAFDSALTYTGTGKTFSISGTNGDVTLDATIGSSAAHAAKYNVAVNDKDGLIQIQRSIYAGSTAGKLAANISLSETGINGSNLTGVLIGNPNGQDVTLSAKGNITVTGANVGLGHAISSSSGRFGKVTLKAGKNVSLTAQGVGSHSGQIGITAQGGNTGGVVDTSILVQAGGNLTLTGHKVDVRAGSAEAFANASRSATASYDAGVTLKAGGNVTLQSYGGGGRVNLMGGSASAGANGANRFIRTAVADAGITVSAGKAITLAAHEIKLSAGYAVAEAVVNGSASNSASADTGITLTAGTNIALTATGGSINIHAAGAPHNPGGSNGYAQAQFAHATATAHADVELNAVGGIALNATDVTVQAGSHVGVLGIHAPSSQNVRASDGGVAKFTATGDVGFTAGAVGIAINAYGGTAEIKGGFETGYGAVVGASFGGSADMVVQASVDFTTASSLAITGKNVTIQAGTHAAEAAKVSGSHGGIATLDADQGVNLSAKGAMIITATSDVLLDASGGQANAAQVHSQTGAQANLSATGAVTLQAASVSITGSNSVQIEAGYGAARGAKVQAPGSGHAALDAESNVNVTATTGNLSVKGKNNLSIRGGSNLGAGYGTTEFSSSSAVSHTSTSSTKRIHDVHVIHYTQVLASGSGAQATLTGGAAVNLNAKGTLTLSQTKATSGSVTVDAGYGALGDLQTQAGSGGSANLNTKSGVGLQAGKVIISGRVVSLDAGGTALHGASSSFNSSHLRHCAGPSDCNNNSFHNSLPSAGQRPRGNLINGQGSKLNIAADASLTIKAGSVSVTAFGSNLILGGGGFAAQSAQITAQDGAVADANLSNQVNITATGAVTLAALHQTGLHGGSESREFALKASSASADLVVTSGVDITAATMKLTAGSSVHISAGNNNGSEVNISAAGHGVAKATLVTGVTLTAKTALAIGLTGSAHDGSIVIRSGRSDGRFVQVAAHAGGSAALDITDDVDLQVTAAAGTLAISAGKHVQGDIRITAGDSDGRGSSSSTQHVLADHGTAGLDVTGNVNLSALGTVTLAAGKGDHSYAGGNLDIEGASDSLAGAARAHASSGGKATFTVAGNTTISGGNIGLTAGNQITIFGGGSSNGRDVHVTASSGGVASVDATAITTIKATGALNITGGHELRIDGDSGDNGRDALVSAGGGKAQATYTLDESVNLSGATGVSLRTGGSLSISGNDSGDSGTHGQIKATAQGKATYDQTASVTITTGGTFTAAAAHEIAMHGASSMGGFGNSVSASGGGATAAYVADGTLKVSAHAIKISASSMSLHGGRGAAAASAASTAARAHAVHGGSAALSVDQSLDLTAVAAFSAKLTGLGASHHLYIEAEGRTGSHASASASGAVSKATVTATAAANVLVTGAGGTITLSTGKQTDASIYVGGSRSTGAGMHADAVKHGTATVTATGGATLSAKGAVSLSEINGNLSIDGAYSNDGQGMHASASTGGKATATANVDVSITGASVTLTTGGSLDVIGARVTAGDSMEAKAKTGGAATATLDAQATLTALSGALTLTGGSMTLVAADQDVGNNDVITGSRGGTKAAVSLDAHVLLNGATGVSLVTTAGAMRLLGGDSGRSSHASHAVITAKDGGHANLTEDMGLSIVTGGAFTANAGGASGSLDISGAPDLGDNMHVTGSSAGAVAAANLTGGVVITAKSIALNATGKVKINGGNDAAFSDYLTANGGSAAVTADTSVSLNATAGAITIRGVGLTSIAGGRKLAAGAGATSSGVGGRSSFNINSGTGGHSRSTSSHRTVQTATVTAHDGIAILNGNAGINLTATGGISVTQTAVAASLVIQGGSGAASKTRASASTHGAATVDGEADVSFKAGGALTLNGHNVKVLGGNSAAVGAASSFRRASVSHCVGTACGSHQFILNENAPVRTNGAGATAKLTGGADVNVQAASVAITAASSLKILGGDGAAFSDKLTASGGSAAVTADASVSLNATGGSITIRGVGLVNIAGGHKTAAGAVHSASFFIPAHSFNTNSVSGGKSHSNSSHRIVQTATATGHDGIATLNGNAGINLTATGGISVTQTAVTASLEIQGGSGAASLTRAIASGHGTATVDGEADVNFKAGGALTLKGHSVKIFGGNSAAVGAPSSFQRTSVSHCVGTVCGNPNFTLIENAPVRANGAGATAKLTGGADVNVQAASVAITAASNLDLSGGAFAAESAQAQAGDGGKALVSGHAVLNIKTPGAITLTAGHDVEIGGGFANAGSARVRTSQSFATASVAAHTSLVLNAGGALTVTAKGISVFGSGDGVESAEVVAFGSGAIAKLDVEADVTLTAASVTMTATGLASSGNLFFHGGFSRRGQVTALDGGSATTTIDDGVSLSATGAVSLTALHGSIAVIGGSGGQSVQAAGGSASTARGNLDIHSGVSITAGTSLTLKAGASVDLIGGGSNLVNLQASYGGSAVAELDASVKLSAGSNVSLTATHGDIVVAAGALNGILVGVDQSISHNSTSTGSIGGAAPGGIVNGTLDASVTITAGKDVDLKAGGNVFVAAGAGETLAVGALRKVFLTTTSDVVTGSSSKYVGNAWGGGSAQLSENLDAAIVAGRDINVSAGTAGSGNIVVQGLERNPASSTGLVNVVSVRGGDSGAVANVSLTADASLTAGRDIVLNAKGGASVDAGSLTFVAADHTEGSVSVTASAGATLHAGRNVVLNAITGSLTVGGINVNSSHFGRVSAEALTSSSGKATVTAHADAAITAVGNISTVSSLGGALNVVGGQFVGAHAVGSGSFMGAATATGNASITAGGNLSIKTKGDLNVLGGDFNVASASAHSAGGAVRSANMQATAGIAAGGQVSLTIGGNATLAGGDSMAVAAAGSPVGGAQLAAAGDVSASIQGAGITLTVAKNLLVRAGSGDHAEAVAIGVFNQATATATADVSLAATGNIAITVGKGTVGSASFIAGNDVGVEVFVGGDAPSNHATANTTADMDITAGGNFTLNVAGPLHVSGGQGAGLGAFVGAGSVASSNAAPDGTAAGNVSAKAVITVGGNLTVTIHGGDASLLGGGQAASDAFLTALGSGGSQAHASLNVDSSLTIKVGGALTLTGAGLLTVAAPFLATPAGLPSSSTASGGAVSGKIKSGISIRGKSVNLNNGHNIGTPSSGFTFSSGGFVFDNTVTIANTGGGSPIDATPAPLSLHGMPALGAAHSLLRASPMSSGFGGVRSLSEWQAVPVSGMSQPQPQSVDSGAVQLPAPAVQTLDTLQTQGLTLSLVTVVGDAAPASTDAATLFTPGLLGSSDQTAFFGSCNTLLLPQPAQSYRCTAGGK